MPNEVNLAISTDGLNALADMALAPKNQAQLDGLLTRNAVGKLSTEETQELDRLLKKSDEFNLVKARAAATLNESRLRNLDERPRSCFGQNGQNAVFTSLAVSLAVRD